jgi:hypothetical protein
MRSHFPNSHNDHLNSGGHPEVSQSGACSMFWKVSLVAAAGVFVPMLALAEPNPAVRSACTSDVKALCGSIQPGGGRIRDCMKQHSSQLSPACKAAAMAGH